MSDKVGQSGSDQPKPILPIVRTNKAKQWKNLEGIDLEKDVLLDVDTFENFNSGRTTRRGNDLFTLGTGGIVIKHKGEIGYSRMRGPQALFFTLQI